MKKIITGTAGHVDHGKSSLLKALTGGAVDRLPEEKLRGITLEPGFTFMKNNGGIIYFVDVPGHETLIRNMITGVCGIGAALFAVDVNEGIRAQTREHAFILKAAGIKNITAAVTKCDTADKELIEKRIKETADFFEKRGFCARVIPVSVYDGESMEKLRGALWETEAPRPAGIPFRMNIDRVFTVKGAGTVVTGSVQGGSVKKNDEIFIWPLNKAVRVKGIQSAGENAAEAERGMRAALNLANTEVKEIKKGSVAYAPGSYIPAARYRIELTAAPGRENALKDNKIYNIFLGTGKTRGRLLLKSGRIVLEKPFPASFGEVFFIRGGSPETTLAAGKLLTPEKTERSVKKEDIKNRPFPGRLPGTGDETEENPAPPYWEICLKLLEENPLPTPKRALAQTAGITDREAETALKYLANREKIVTLENACLTYEKFSEYTKRVKDAIKENGCADIASARKATGLSRNHCAALLDKGDRLGVWRNEGGKRY